MNTTNTIILGLGTGRCGTVNLSNFLRQQPCMALCTHEHLKWKWYSEGIIKADAFKKYEKFQNSIVGDVGSFLLPHVKKIANFFKQTKIIVLQRNKEDTIKSWMKWTNEIHNYLVPHTKGKWQNDGWDPMFPKFDMEDEPKEKVIAKYYDYYYEESEKLKDCFNVLWIRTESLDNIKTRELICKFCEFNLPNCKLDVTCKRNAGPNSKKKVSNIPNIQLKKRFHGKTIHQSKRNKKL